MKNSTWDNVPRATIAPGVDLRLINGDNCMLTYVIMQPGAVVPDHKHPHEQVGTCIKGEGVMVCGGKQFKTIPGACWLILGGESHSWRNTSEGETILLEAFSPPREDYIAKAK